MVRRFQIARDLHRRCRRRHLGNKRAIALSEHSETIGIFIRNHYRGSTGTQLDCCVAVLRSSVWSGQDCRVSSGIIFDLNSIAALGIGAEDELPVFHIVDNGGPRADILDFYGIPCNVGIRVAQIGSS